VVAATHTKLHTQSPPSEALRLKLKNNFGLYRSKIIDSAYITNERSTKFHKFARLKSLACLFAVELRSPLATQATIKYG